MTLRMPSLSGGGGGGGGGDALFDAVTAWLAACRGQLGTNARITLLDMHPTERGITCGIINVVEYNDMLRTLFKQFSPSSDNVVQRFSDDTQRNLYKVNIGYPPNWSELNASLSSMTNGSSLGIKTSLWDEPKTLIMFIVVWALSAALTTESRRWMNLARMLAGAFQ